MAEDTIRRIFFNPSVAIARLGGSTTPLEAFEWAPGHPHTIAETRIRPAWTLNALGDGTVQPTLPTRLVLRDGPLLRPLAPYLELWALVGDGPQSALTAVPVTPGLLQANGAQEAALSFTIEAMNRKAARRTRDSLGPARSAALRFGTFPPVRVRGDDHRPAELLGVSPPDAARPMLPRGRSIPLGRLQVMRPTVQPPNPPWPPEIRIDAIRLRFTPPRGRLYGPPEAAEVQPDPALPAVPRERAFLEPGAGWAGAPRSPRVVPADTVDDRPGPVPDQLLSLGVVDDTCDARLLAELALATGTLRCGANITVGPPHFAPDRRPFLSLADEINDRQHDPGRDRAMTPAERATWVEDLFERVFETASLLDLDFWRRNLARPLVPAEQRPGIPGDGVPGPERAMGGTDRLRDPNIAIPAPSPNVPQPLSARARERHRNLSDIGQLELWVRSNPERMRELIRTPFATVDRDSRRQTMQMPPFMRNSNFGALSLARWQYDLLMAWVDAVLAPEVVPRALELAPLSAEAAERRRRVLATLPPEDAPGEGGRDEP